VVAGWPERRFPSSGFAKGRFRRVGIEEYADLGQDDLRGQAGQGVVTDLAGSFKAGMRQDDRQGDIADELAEFVSRAESAAQSADQGGEDARLGPGLRLKDEKDELVTGAVGTLAFSLE